jgi:hypothetical protein
MDESSRRTTADNSTNLGCHAGDDHKDDGKRMQEDDGMSHSREFRAAEVDLADAALLYVMLLRYPLDLASKKRKDARTYILHLTAQF